VSVAELYFKSWMSREREDAKEDAKKTGKVRSAELAFA
jgi:hypothetical protein